MILSKTLKKITLVSASALMMLSLGAGINNTNAQASTHHNHIEIDVFPSKSTHSNFAYQTHRHGHIHFASKNSKLGKKLFGKKAKKQSTYYAKKLMKHHAKKYRALLMKLAKTNKKSNTFKSNPNKIIQINATYNGTRAKALINTLHKRYHHLVIRKDIGYVGHQKVLFGYFVGLHNNSKTRSLIWHLHKCENAEQIKNSSVKHHKHYNHNDIKWVSHHVTGMTLNYNVATYARKHHKNVVVYEYIYR